MKVLFCLALIWGVFFVISPLETKSWLPTKSSSPSYAKATTRSLEDVGALQIAENKGLGPEDMEIDENGLVYTGLDNGDFISIDDAGKETVYVNTGGRILGMDRAPDGSFILADAEKGLLKYNIKTRQLVVLLDEAEGLKLGFTDDISVSKRGIVYFSDAAQRYNFRNYVYDAIEHNKDGRIISYDLNTGETKVLVKDLYFANGVALSEDESFLVYNESWIRRVNKLYLSGDKKGTTEVFADNLPGIPDGVSKGDSGIYWVAIAAEKSKFLELFSRAPFVRKLLVSIAPQAFFPKHDSLALVLGFSAEGSVRYVLEDKEGRAYSNITSVEEIENKLYFGSLKNRSIGVYDMKW